jgi:1-acyl-sn-glycerol-3-phosphate acyltransferase
VSVTFDPRLVKGFYALSKVVVGAIFRAIWGLKAIDPQNVPMSGPVIIACNHIAYLDPPSLGVCSPRRVEYMAKQELFDIPFLGQLITLLGAFPVDRSRGDTAAMKTALGVLKGGACLGIFPEGTRNRGQDPLEPGLGTALLAHWSGATVVPTFVTGTNKAKDFARFTVRFGKPITIDKSRKASRDDLAKWSDELMKRIYELRESTSGH